MKFSEFLEKVEQNFDNPSENTGYSAAAACSKFEREVYRSLGGISIGNYRRFYSLILSHLETFGELASLDKKSSDILLRNLDTAMEVLPESASVISRISTLLP